MESITIKFTKSTTLLEVDVYIQKVLKLIHPDTEIEINTNLAFESFYCRNKEKNKTIHLVG